MNLPDTMKIIQCQTIRNILLDINRTPTDSEVGTCFERRRLCIATTHHKIVAPPNM